MSSIHCKVGALSDAASSCSLSIFALCLSGLGVAQLVLVGGLVVLLSVGRCLVTVLGVCFGLFLLLFGLFPFG